MKTLSLSVLSLLIGCGGALGPAPEEMREEARATLPSGLALHSAVIARSCSPNPGVCHQSSNYPDLRTLGSLRALIGARCNLEIPDPHGGFDGCEPKADRFAAYTVPKAGGEEPGPRTFAAEIAWKQKLAPGQWKLGLRQAPVTSTTALPQIEGDELVRLYADPFVGVTAALVAGSTEVLVQSAALGDEDYSGVLDMIMPQVAAGDPNQNGVYGFERPDQGPSALITPGSLERSYLFGRVTGTVPGTRMPLANQPLSDPEYLALACWIEGLAESSDDTIDYDRCAFAQSPVSYTGGR